VVSDWVDELSFTLVLVIIYCVLSDTFFGSKKKKAKVMFKTDFESP
jgi:hypothetical protein